MTRFLAAVAILASVSGAAWGQSNIGMSIAGTTPPKATGITFTRSGISMNMETGEVTIPDALPLTDAARAFWDEVRRLGPSRTCATKDTTP